MSLQAKIDRIKNNLDAQAYTVAAGESVKIIEISFRKLLVDGLATLSDQDRLKVMQAILDIGKGEKGVESFGLGHMLAVLRKSKFNDAWESATGTNLSAIKMINFDALNEIRIKITHDAAEVSQFEAEVLYQAVQGIVQSFSSVLLNTGADNSYAAPEPNSDVADSTVQELIKKTQAGESSYSPVQFDELERLRIQSKLVEDVDLRAFKYALNLMDKKKGLIGLDIGCSEGFVTHERFSSFGMFEHVFGVDKSKEAIEQAKVNGYEGSYNFYAADLESSEGIATLKNALKEKGATGFDVIFSAYVFHHLKNPIKVLRELRKLLNPNGVIIVRTVDDKLSASYPDQEEIVHKIFELSDRIPGMSSREHGRKLYNELWKTGYRNLNMHYEVLDTVGKSIDERLMLFQDNFSWRPNYVKRAMEAFPEKRAELERDLEWLENALEELEIMFESEDYFHMEPIVVAVGQKK
ncbi:MAG: methyltransferase domain-containing protein [Mariprofundaceae bacterium]|nr:methyltransferase domain-containing protein [Mariprofundaceae bacterium]